MDDTNNINSSPSSGKCATAATTASGKWEILREGGGVTAALRGADTVPISGVSPLSSTGGCSRETVGCPFGAKTVEWSGFSRASGNRTDRHQEEEGRERDTEDCGWNTFDIAFQGKTATVGRRDVDLASVEATPVAMEEETDTEDDNGNMEQRGLSSSESAITVDSINEQDRVLKKPTMFPVGATSWGWMRKPPPVAPRRWVDQCRQYSSSESVSNSCSTSSQSLNSVEDANAAANKAAEQVSLLASESRGNGHGRRGNTSSVAKSVDAQQRFTEIGHRHHRNSTESNHSDRYRPCRILRGASPSNARRARRLPLGVYHGNSGASSAPRRSSHGIDDTSNANTAADDRVFAWFVLLHGCLCEAPLAVVEGLCRAPFYLLAAAWVAVVGQIGAAHQPQLQNHTHSMFEQSRALAREGILLFVASLTLAVPFSTCCTVYRGMDADHAWDVRPIPTLLGAVDPLRFFVFAFGQAGELAANGRPEPLNFTPDHLTERGVGRGAHGGTDAIHGRYFPHICTSSAAADDVVGILNQQNAMNVSSDLEMGEVGPAEGGGGGSKDIDERVKGCAHYSPVKGTHFCRSSSLYSSPCFGVAAAQSMDADRFGVGILHPPHEVGVRCSKTGARTKRGLFAAYRRYVASAARLMNISDNAAGVE